MDAPSSSTMCKWPPGRPLAHASMLPEWAGESCRVNITLGPKEERLLMTGLHTVADIYCTCCNTVLGWKYVRSWVPPSRRDWHVCKRASRSAA